MSICWGKTERVKFSGAWKLESWNPPQVSGIYAITFKQDPENNPKKHTVIYFGQSENLAAEGLPWDNEHSDAWVHSVSNKGDLFVFVHPMPGATTLERWRLHERLVAEYVPLCNRR